MLDVACWKGICVIRWTFVRPFDFAVGRSLGLQICPPLLPHYRSDRTIKMNLFLAFVLVLLSRIASFCHLAVLLFSIRDWTLYQFLLSDVCCAQNCFSFWWIFNHNCGVIASNQHHPLNCIQFNCLSFQSDMYRCNCRQFHCHNSEWSKWRKASQKQKQNNNHSFHRKRKEKDRENDEQLMHDVCLAIFTTTPQFSGW